MAPHPPAAETPDPDGRLTPAQVFAALQAIRRPHTVLVEESPSNLAALHQAWPIAEPDAFYTFASGGLGWGLPAAVGIALAERDSERNRPVLILQRITLVQNIESSATVPGRCRCRCRCRNRSRKRLRQRTDTVAGFSASCTSPTQGA
jgi:hypothetical protein